MNSFGLLHNGMSFGDVFTGLFFDALSHAWVYQVSRAKSGCLDVLDDIETLHCSTSIYISSPTSFGIRGIFKVNRTHAMSINHTFCISLMIQASFIASSWFSSPPELDLMLDVSFGSSRFKRA